MVHLGLCCVCILIALAAWCIFAHAVYAFSFVYAFGSHPCRDNILCILLTLLLLALIRLDLVLFCSEFFT